MHILDRYILKTHIPPYFFSVSVITFVFVMDFLFRYLDLFIGRGVAFLVVLEFFTLSLGHMFALIIPMSVMPATLMAFGQLASENEITAMKANGISLYRMIAPVLIAGAVLGISQIYYQNVVLPESNHRFLNLYIDIGKMKPTLEIKENIFSTAIKGYTILVREKNDKTGEIKDIQIFEKKKGGVLTTIVALRGRMRFIEEANVLRFELEDGEIHEMPDPKDISTYRKTLFSHFTLNMQDIDRSLERSERTSRTDREMTVGMMKEQIADKREEIAGYRMTLNHTALTDMKTALSKAIPSLAPPEKDREPERPLDEASSGAKPIFAGATLRGDRAAEKTLRDLESSLRIIAIGEQRIRSYQVEIHKKFSIPFSCMVFVLMGAPLAIRSGKKGMTMAIGFSILFFLIYYICLIGGEKLADRDFVSPWLAMWAPNIIFLAAAVLLIRSTARESSTINWDRLDLLKKWRSRSGAAIF